MMHLRLSVVLLSACALAAPGATVHGKDKDKNKDNKEQKSDDREDDRDDNDRDRKMTICHVPSGNRSAQHTIWISESAWKAHQGHGDHRGRCPAAPTSARSFNHLDTNNDNLLSFEEFRGDRTTFDRLDRNDNQLLTRDEFYHRR